jgi:hypothetical protein
MEAGSHRACVASCGSARVTPGEVTSQNVFEVLAAAVLLDREGLRKACELLLLQVRWVLAAAAISRMAPRPWY